MSKPINYVETVQASGLVTSRQLAEMLTSGGELLSPEDGARIGDRLIKAGLLTPWQHAKLIKGNSKGFFIGKYKLLNLLGTGGNAAVYLAEHTLLKHRRAVKVLPATEQTKSSSLDRFLQEAQVIASLDHPNIVRAYDVDKLGKYYYIAMEYVQGVDLEKMVETDGKLEPKLAADCIRQAALGLAHAHEKGIVHRDIKPGNLLLDQTQKVKVLDLGLARLLDGDQPSITRKHNENFMGTADYLSPEQAMDSHDVDHRTDIYSLGCTLYFLLVGKPPFGEGALAERLIKHLKTPPPSLIAQRPELSPALEAICFKMLAKAQDDRQATMTEVAEQLGHWIETGELPASLADEGAADTIVFARDALNAELVGAATATAPPLSATAHLAGLPTGGTPGGSAPATPALASAPTVAVGGEATQAVPHSVLESAAAANGSADLPRSDSALEAQDWERRAAGNGSGDTDVSAQKETIEEPSLSPTEQPALVAEDEHEDEDDHEPAVTPRRHAAPPPKAAVPVAALALLAVGVVVVVAACVAFFLSGTDAPEKKRPSQRRGPLQSAVRDVTERDFRRG